MIFDSAACDTGAWTGQSDCSTGRPEGQHACAGQSGRSTGRTGNGRTHVRASSVVPRAWTSLGDITGHAAGPRTAGRTRSVGSTNSLYLRKRHHQLLGIHHGIAPSLGPLGHGANLCVQSDQREHRAGRFLSCSGETCERSVQS